MKPKLVEDNSLSEKLRENVRDQKRTYGIWIPTVRDGTLRRGRGRYRITALTVQPVVQSKDENDLLESSNSSMTDRLRSLQEAKYRLERYRLTCETEGKKYTDRSERRF